jgi:cytochrome c biogenesis protein CcmG/thiol:disulfide interchange protein DsbE
MAVSKNVWIGTVLAVAVLSAAAYFSTVGQGEATGSGSAPTENKAGSQQGGQNAEIETAAQVGFRAPDFELTDFNGQTVRLSDLRGKPVILNFWASWCGPCKSEMPDLQAIYEQYKDKAVFYGVNLTVQDSEEKARRFVQDMGLTFPMLLDKTGKPSTDYRIFTVPTTYVIDKDGIIMEIRRGALQKAALDGMLQRITKS